jgi:hypothetical protein
MMGRHRSIAPTNMTATPASSSRVAVDASLIKADANRQSGVQGTEGLEPVRSRRAVREYLAVLDDVAFGAATPLTPKYFAPVDPAARWTAANGGLAFFAYATNYLIDVDHAIIVDVEASSAERQAEVTAAKTMIARTGDRFDLHPDRLAADTAYGSAEMLNWLVNEQGIEPHVPVFDKSQRTDGTFARDDFTYDQERDIYVCPGGKHLTTSGTLVTMVPPCSTEPPRPTAPPAFFNPVAVLTRQCGECRAAIHEGARDLARNIAKTARYSTSRRQRKKVEMCFAHLKRILKLDRLRLRGPVAHTIVPACCHCSGPEETN